MLSKRCKNAPIKRCKKSKRHSMAWKWDHLGNGYHIVYSIQHCTLTREMKDEYSRSYFYCSWIENIHSNHYDNWANQWIWGEVVVIMGNEGRGRGNYLRKGTMVWWLGCWQGSCRAPPCNNHLTHSGSNRWELFGGTSTAWSQMWGGQGWNLLAKRSPRLWRGWEGGEFPGK